VEKCAGSVSKRNALGQERGNKNPPTPSSTGGFPPQFRLLINQTKTKKKNAKQPAESLDEKKIPLPHIVKGGEKLSCPPCQMAPKM